MANNSNGTFVITKTPAGVGIFITALNIFLSIFATLGNALILLALRKVSAIHPPTKLLFRCLAVTDLCVGLISQPLYVYYIFTSYLEIGNLTIEHVFVVVFFYNVLLAVSPLTSAAISINWQTSRSVVGAEIQTCCNFMPSSCGHSLFLVHCCFKRFFDLGLFNPIQW